MCGLEHLRFTLSNIQVYNTELLTIVTMLSVSDFLSYLAKCPQDPYKLTQIEDFFLSHG